MTTLYLWSRKRPGPDWELVAVKDGGYWENRLWRLWWKEEGETNENSCEEL
jgi:hypothetical protein